MKYAIMISAVVGTLGLIFYWPLYFVGYSAAVYLLYRFMKGASCNT